MNGSTSGQDSLPAELYRKRWVRILAVLLAIPTVLAIVFGLYLWQRFGADRATEYADIEDHFKYGSTGGEHVSGLPYWIFQALPQVCGLPGGYASLGFIYEEGRDLPIGMSKRHHQGIDKTFLNCAVCHVSTVRDTPSSKPRVYLGMPAMQLDIMGFEKFLFNCAKSEKFASEFVVPEARRVAQANGQDLGLLDRYLVYPVAVALMRERLLMLRDRFLPLQTEKWGPGRVDTWNSAKAGLSFVISALPEHERRGAVDFPSIWNQRQRKRRDDGQPMQLHWTGNNRSVEERNLSAAFGTGTTPRTVDHAAIARLEDWLLDAAPPPFPFPIDRAKAARGAAVYAEHCASCHGKSGRDFRGPYVGHVTPIAAVGTDGEHYHSYTYELAANQNVLYAETRYRFTHFRKTDGYANMPLDGIWLRGPYLHNGSVPTLRELLDPPDVAARTFYRGYDVLDPVRVGFVSDVPEEKGRKFTFYDTRETDQSNRGHSTAWSCRPPDKDAHRRVPEDVLRRRGEWTRGRAGAGSRLRGSRWWRFCDPRVRRLVRVVQVLPRGAAAAVVRHRG